MENSPGKQKQQCQPFLLASGTAVLFRLDVLRKWCR